MVRVFVCVILFLSVDSHEPFSSGRCGLCHQESFRVHALAWEEERLFF